MSQNPYQPPESGGEGLAPQRMAFDFDIPLASRWKRLGGALLDSVVLLCAVSPLIILLTVDLENVEAMEADMTRLEEVAWLAVTFVAWLVINAYTLHTRGQSIGKLVVGSRIVSRVDRRLLPLWRIVLLRALPVHVASALPVTGELFGLVDALFIFREDRRCVHDLMAGTIVIDAKSPLSASRR